MKSIFNKEGLHYNILSYEGEHDIRILKELFPEGQANALNFCLFSTSGVHGSYAVIEEIEMELQTPPEDEDDRMEIITFLVVHPRTVTLRYGNVKPENQDDIVFLKELRRTSLEVVQMIGF